VLAEIRRDGAMAAVEWPVAAPEPAWARVVTGVDATGRDGSPLPIWGAAPAPGATGLGRVAAWVAPAAVSRPNSPTPPLWALLLRAGLSGELTGWWPGFGSGFSNLRVASTQTYDSLRALVTGPGIEPGTPITRSGIPGRLRDLARAPWEDWRAGGTAAPAEAAVLDAADRLPGGVPAFLRDRFGLRVAREWGREDERALRAAYVAFPRAATLAAREPTQLERAILGYFEYLDAQLRHLRGDLRAGEVLLLLFAPPPETPLAPQSRTAVAMFFGEKVRPGASGQAVLTMPDLTVTLVYLLGIPISREIGGQVAWDVLAPDLASRLPPRHVESYR
jgi:hypothetical protein